MDDKTPKSEEKPADPLKPNYLKDHRKSFKELSYEITQASKKQLKADKTDDVEEVKEDKPTEAKIEPVVEPKVESKPEDKVEPKIDPQKIAEEAAKKAAEELDKKRLQAEKEAADKKAQDEAKVLAWQKENRSPKDYDEIVTETKRLAREEILAEIRAEREKERQAAEQKTFAQQQEEERIKQLNDQNRRYVEKRLAEELDRMYQNKVIDKPVDETDKNDPAAKRLEAILKKGVEVNKERMANGQEPIMSVADIYYNYYLPTEKKDLPGADAPIAGARTSPVSRSDQKISYKEIHNTPLRDLLSKVIKK